MTGDASDPRRAPRVLTTPASDRYRNFDMLRLIMASAVVFSHSFWATEHTEVHEPFVRLLGEHNIAGLYGVFGFFVISGFLITRSFQQRASWQSFLVSRILRIFPALIAAALVCAFLLGPIITVLGVGDYLREPRTYRFVAESAMFRDDSAGLPGVMFWPEPDGYVIFATMWTLLPEFLCYLIVLIAGVLGLLRLPLALVALGVGLWTHSAHWAFAAQLGYLGAYFAAGSALYFVHRWRRPGLGVCLVAGAGMVLSAFQGWPHEGFAVFGSVLLIQLATSTRIHLPDGAKYGDLSYGIYLYGWPVQGLLSWVSGNRVGWLPMFVLALPLSAACAWVSWHVVERRAIALGQRFRNWSRQRQIGRADATAPT